MDFAINTVYSSERPNLISFPLLILNNGLQLLRGKSDHSPFSESIHVPIQHIEETDSVYNGSSITFSESASMVSNMKSIIKLRSFLSFHDDWNGYGAKPFSEEYIRYAETLLANLPIEAQVYPISDGRVQLEFDKDDGSYLEFEINDDKSVGVFEILPDKSEREYKANSEDITRIVKRFYE